MRVFLIAIIGCAFLAGCFPTPEEQLSDDLGVVFPPTPIIDPMPQQNGSASAETTLVGSN